MERHWPMYRVAAHDAWKHKYQPLSDHVLTSVEHLQRKTAQLVDCSAKLATRLISIQWRKEGAEFSLCLPRILSGPSRRKAFMFCWCAVFLCLLLDSQSHAPLAERARQCILCYMLYQFSASTSVTCTLKINQSINQSININWTWKIRSDVWRESPLNSVGDQKVNNFFLRDFRSVAVAVVSNFRFLKDSG